MAIQGDEPTSSANIKALTDNLKTWVTNQIDAAKTWTSSQITTAINNLKKTTAQEKELFYNAEGGNKGTYNANGCKVARISFSVTVSNRTSYYVIEVPFTSGTKKVNITAAGAGSYIEFSKTEFRSNGVEIIRIIGII